MSRTEKEDVQGEGASEAESLRRRVGAKRVCPYCGVIANEGVTHCQRCGMEDSEETRRATRSRIGPWSVLRAKNPAAPGMNFATLMELVRKGQVTATTVVRGPTTQQMWTFASRVKGVAREFGVCWECGGSVEKDDTLCGACGKLQEPPMDVDVMIEGGAAGGVAKKPRVPARGSELARGRRKSDVILNQKELAAAFAIDPEKGEAGVPRLPRKKGWRVAVVLVVLGAAGAASYVTYHPAEARAWYAKGLEWVASVRK